MPNRTSSVMEEEKETSSENKTVDARSAVDDAVEETKKRTILGDGDGKGEDNTTNEGADAAAIPDEHDEVEDVEKGSMENCDVEKDESGDGEPADDSDTKRSSPLQSSPPKRRKSGTGEPSSSEVDLSKQIYHVKWIGWHDTRCPIIMQNVNGPCPLLSMINVLLLRGKMTLKEGTEVVSSEQLLENIGERTILELPEPYSHTYGVRKFPLENTVYNSSTKIKDIERNGHLQRRNRYRCFL